MGYFSLFYTLYIRLLRGWLGALVVEESCLAHEHGDGFEAQIVFRKIDSALVCPVPAPGIAAYVVALLVFQESADDFHHVVVGGA